MSKLKKMKSASYTLTIDGKKLSHNKLSLIDSIEFEDNSTGSDTLTINIVDPDFEFIEDDIFIEDNPITFKGRYGNNTRCSFSGYISAIDIEFPDQGYPIIQVHCMDMTHLMNREKKKRTWNNKKRSDVVRIIAREYGLKTDIDDTGRVEETISQSDTTDINFINQLPSQLKDPYLVYVENNTFHFKKKKILEEPQATLHYRKEDLSIISFNPQITKETKQIEVEKSDVNHITKGVDKAVADDTLNRDVQGTPPKTTNTSAPKDRKHNTDGSKRHYHRGGNEWTTIEDGGHDNRGVRHEIE